MTTTHAYENRIAQLLNGDAGLSMSAEARARALQAAHIGALSGKVYNAVAGAVAALYRRWREWVERQRSIAYLEQLDERLLADIGLSRATLQETLRRPANEASDIAVVPPVAAVISETAKPATAANQDRRIRRTAA